MTAKERRRAQLKAVQLDALALRNALISETENAEYIPVRLVVRAVCNLCDTVNKLAEVG